eukprot:scaffold34612_cov165-Amphora_coffeaeformis.AAC.2
MKGWTILAVVYLLHRAKANVANSERRPLGIRSKPLSSRAVAFTPRGAPPRGGSSSVPKNQLIQLRIEHSAKVWWFVPILVMITSYFTFPSFSDCFHRFVVWASDDSWLPDTPEKLSLLSNVVTQVVNGPVVASISILFATMITTTISTLHSRQQDVQLSLINEIEALRCLQNIVRSPLYSKCVSESEMQAIAERIEVLRIVVKTESTVRDFRPQKQSSPHDYIAFQSDHLLLLCDQIDLNYCDHRKHRQDPAPLLLKIRSLVETVRAERKSRWLAITGMHFPAVHYITLTMLGLQVRLLWSILVTCFSSVAVVCADLADAFSGAYAVETDYA